MPDRDTANLRINLSLTPTYSYTRAGCRNTAVEGPSCYPPLVAVRPDLPQDLLPQNYQPRPISRPAGTVVSPSEIWWRSAPVHQPLPEPCRPNLRYRREWLQRTGFRDQRTQPIR